jgi:hypothetical protein
MRPRNDPAAPGDQAATFWGYAGVSPLRCAGTLDLPKMARRIAANFAKLPELLLKKSGLGNQQRFVTGVDDAGERGTALLAFEVVTFKAALIDVGTRASVQR